MPFFRGEGGGGGQTRSIMGDVKMTNAVLLLKLINNSQRENQGNLTSLTVVWISDLNKPSRLS